jgi:hypothetical protein
LELVGEGDGLGGRRAGVNGVEARTTVVGAAGGQRLLLVETAFLAAVEAGLLADLGEGDGAGDAPEAVAVREVELAEPGPAEEGAAGRLHHVLGTDAAAQARRQVAAGEAVQRAAVAVAELPDHGPVAGAEAVDQPPPAALVVAHRPVPSLGRRAFAPLRNGILARPRRRTQQGGRPPQYSPTSMV